MRMRDRLTSGLGAVAILALMTSATAASEPDHVVGRWLTQGGEGVIAIARCGSSICGRIDWMESPPGMQSAALPRDRYNPDPTRRQQSICGLKIIYGFTHDRIDPNRWEAGSIYDPQSGHTYQANITLEDSDHLQLHGYIGIPLLGATQVWTRVAENQPRCRAG
jgi:uncharacterized protein (DUF2147 family)